MKLFSQFNFICSLCWLYSFFLSCSTLQAEDRANNPLYKALPCINSVLEKLLETAPSQPKGWVSIPFRQSLEANWIATEDCFFQDIGIQLIEKNFNRFDQEASNGSNQTSDHLISPIVHLIWLGSQPPSQVHLVAQSWKMHHPQWEIKLWTDEDIEQLEWSSPRSQRLFEQGKNWSEKSDILRLEVLYKFGGIYSDTDVFCLKPFTPFLSTQVSFFAGLESNKIKRFGRPLIGSALIGAAKNHPIIKRCIEHTKSIEEAPGIHQHLRAGPGPISKACYEAIEAGEEHVLILPCSYVYPLPWEKRLSSFEQLLETIQPESFAIHLWEGSWFDFYIPPQISK